MLLLTDVMRIQGMNLISSIVSSIHGCLQHAIGHNNTLLRSYHYNIDRTVIAFVDAFSASAHRPKDHHLPSPNPHRHLLVPYSVSRYNHHHRH